MLHFVMQFPGPHRVKKRHQSNCKHPKQPGGNSFEPSSTPFKAFFFPRTQRQHAIFSKGLPTVLQAMHRRVRGQRTRRREVKYDSITFTYMKMLQIHVKEQLNTTSELDEPPSPFQEMHSKPCGSDKTCMKTSKGNCCNSNQTNWRTERLEQSLVLRPPLVFMSGFRFFHSFEWE